MAKLNASAHTPSVTYNLYQIPRHEWEQWTGKLVTSVLQETY